MRVYFHTFTVEDFINAHFFTFNNGDMLLHLLKGRKNVVKGCHNFIQKKRHMSFSKFEYEDVENIEYIGDVKHDIQDMVARYLKTNINYKVLT